jgi:putative glycosyltransferase (TIGR04348 family)
MDILIVTPAKSGSAHGNRTTADRWAKILTQLGHQVLVKTTYNHQDPDILIALHAWRSADSISLFNQKHPDRPLILALTGTDINHFKHTESETVNHSLQSADVLITLNDMAKQQLSPTYQKKCVTIYQSSQIHVKRKISHRHFNICVSGHLRAEKDPFRTAMAARSLPSSSRIRIQHFGYAHSPFWAQQARFETAKNRRYEWQGGLPQQRWFSLLQQSQCMVLSSYQEGGANVISEALIAKCPILASHIAGNIGLLGENYPGYFPAGDTHMLKKRLLETENNPKFYSALTSACLDRRKYFTVNQEKSAWRKLLATFN